MMKKLMVLFTILLGLMVACSDTETTTEEDKGVVKVEEEPAPAPAPVEVTEDKLVEDYADEMSTYLGDFSKYMGDFSELNMEAGNNPMMMKDDNWIMDTAVTLTMMDDTITKIQGINPPDKLKESHAVVLQGMEKFKYVVDNYPEAVDNLDVNLLTSCVTAMTEGSEYLAEATGMIKELQ
jgi:uncharacterized secreted protein with C-terminal beta-propeller domain